MESAINHGVHARPEAGSLTIQHNRPPTMKTEINAAIANVDFTLRIIRGHWLKPRAGCNVNWWDRIMDLLDERLRLMALRDQCDARA